MGIKRVIVSGALCLALFGESGASDIITSVYRGRVPGYIATVSQKNYSGSTHIYMEAVNRNNTDMSLLMGEDIDGDGILEWDTIRYGGKYSFEKTSHAQRLLSMAVNYSRR